METNESATDGSTQVSEIEIDLLGSFDQPEPTEGKASSRDGQPSEARVSIPHGQRQAVRATVKSTDGGRWRCDFHVDPSSVAVSQPMESEQMDQISELSEWVVPVLNIIEALVTEAGC